MSFLRDSRFTHPKSSSNIKNIKSINSIFIYTVLPYGVIDMVFRGPKKKKHQKIKKKKLLFYIDRSTTRD